MLKVVKNLSGYQKLLCKVCIYSVCTREKVACSQGVLKLNLCDSFTL